VADLPVGVRAAAVGGGSVWLDDGDGTLLRVSERTGSVVARVHPGVDVVEAAFTPRTV
jgi:hypothetical protein